jgi:5'-deoxynucleotidase YfbR-like HD superfamily hydrolase
MSVARSEVRDREEARVDVGMRLNRAADELMQQLGGSRTLASRMTGEVRRYHCWHLNREQTTADHQWHVLRIYVQLFGVPDDVTMAHLAFHDVGELLSSDIQFPLKRFVPELKAITDDAESVMANRVGLDFSPHMDERSLWRFKACDLLEMYEFSTREVMSGNTGTGSVVRRRIYQALVQHMRSRADADAASIVRHVEEIDRWLKTS